MLPPVLSLPVEILVLVFQHSDNLAQVAALSSEFKRFYSVWLHNSPSILWYVGSRQIRAFDDALMAVGYSQLQLRQCQVDTVC